MVIQLRNGVRRAWNGKSQGELYLANGEVGILTSSSSGFLNAIFAGQPGVTFEYKDSYDFPDVADPLDWAYALTVHKAQGSDFEIILVVIPRQCLILTRELLHTALTRSRKQLVLLVEGQSASRLNDFRDKSDPARRNTNLFSPVVRERSDQVPFAEHLLHRTQKGHLVRSKSELVIANTLFHFSVQYESVQALKQQEGAAPIHPNFSFTDPAGYRIVWGHLGMMSREDYRQSWERRKKDYEAAGFTVGKNLFTSEDDERGGLDSKVIERLVEQIKELL